MAGEPATNPLDQLRGYMMRRKDYNVSASQYRLCQHERCVRPAVDRYRKLWLCERHLNPTLPEQGVEDLVHMSSPSTDSVDPGGSVDLSPKKKRKKPRA